MIKIKQIFLEKNLSDTPRAKDILNYFPDANVKIIDRYDKIFGKVKKPYLQKRENLNLFIAEKKGNLVKEAPEAYGTKGEKHFYFIHAYNCIYECEYCYLQGYFHSPDLVLFINHEEIVEEIKKVAKQFPHNNIWFHAGEFSDSLALTHITNELDIYFDFFQKNPNLKMELRTKSNNIEALLKQTPMKNIITSFSLSPKKNLDYRAPSLQERLSSIGKLYEKGFPIGIHLDPIIPLKDYQQQYESMIQSLAEVIPLTKVEYFSLGVARFPEKIYQQVIKNYPKSIIFNQELLKDKQGIIRSPKPIRYPMMEAIQTTLQDHGVDHEKIYLCME